MIGELLPAGVVTVEISGTNQIAGLLPDERRVVAGAVDKRRREFAAGRTCARRGLACLGWQDFPVLAGPHREPLWPPGVVGSITHCDGYCAAAVASLDDLQGISALGIDAELNRPFPDRVTAMICRPSERAPLDIPGLSLPALLFSAKESVYKAWFPVAGSVLAYKDVEIEVGRVAGQFTARLLPSVSPDPVPMGLAFRGRYATTASHVFTTVTACNAAS